MKLSPPAFLAPLLARPVAIFGGGVSGDGVCALLAQVGATGTVYDARGTPFVDLRDHRLVVYSPGFTPDHPWLAAARASGALCLGELDFASLFWQGRIVAITGTNGKTTLTEFLTHALRSIGVDAHATGNIGHSFSRLAMELAGAGQPTIAVCEVSSFQAETLQHFRATSTLWTNFAEDHLERHPGLRSYFAAKWRLVERTVASAALPSVFLGTSAADSAKRFGFQSAGIVCVTTLGLAPDPLLAGTVFEEYPQRENFVLAQAWWNAQGLEPAALYAAARSFKLGRHRLTRVAEVDGVVYWNDSKATNFHAVEAALSRFTTPVVLIAGGKAKGGDLRGFVERIAPGVHHVLLIGATSAELAAHCEARSVSFTKCENLENAVSRAAEFAPRGGHVLLSPGFASFDQFRNYEDRGEQFEKLVENLSRKEAQSPTVNLSNLK